MRSEEESIEAWANRLGFRIEQTGQEEYQLIDQRTGIPLKGGFEDLREVAEELRMREER